MALTGFTASSQRSAIVRSEAAMVEPDETRKARLQDIVKGIIATWDNADVVCLGKTMAAEMIPTCALL